MSTQGSTAPLRKLSRIHVGIWTADDVLATAVCECTDPSTYSNGVMVRNGLNDDRMGPFTSFQTCRTCGGGTDTCPGHFGVIRLQEPLYHVGFFTQVYKLLKRLCPQCSAIHSPNAKVCRECEHPIPHRCKQVHSIIETYTPSQRAAFHGELGPLKRTIAASEAARRLQQIPRDRYSELAIAPNQAPQHMLLTVLPVAPPIIRPSVANKGRWIADDLTIKYSAILKANDALRYNKRAQRPQHILTESIEHLQWLVSTLIDATIPTPAKDTQWRSGETRKGLRQRLQGKEGRIRQNLMGKRVDYSARTVITADPNLDIDQVGVPKSIALNLTVPERVTRWNLKAVLERFERGPDDVHGMRFLTKAASGIRYDLRTVNRNRLAKTIEVGDLIERPLQDDDYVVMNRQPSLHKMSMMGHRAKILDWSTFRLNLSVTSPYNADFDGDEMNLHVPQDLPSRAEVEQLMSVTSNFVTPQSNRPVMGIIQDSLLGSYLLTARDIFLDRSSFMNALMYVDGWDGHIPIPAILGLTPLWTGKQLVSLLLPAIEYRRGSTKGLNGDDRGVAVRNGQLLQGRLTKKELGQAYNGVLHLIWKEFGAKRLAVFMTAIQRLVNHWLTGHGFSTGIADCVVSGDADPTIVPKALDQVNRAIGQNLNLIEHPLVETKINRILNNARDLAGEDQLKHLPNGHGMKAMVDAGSKGSLINICQINAIVGQQNVNGARIGFGPKNRTLPHFAAFDYGPASKGFVQSSYIEGLSPVSPSLLQLRRFGLTRWFCFGRRASFFSMPKRDEKESSQVHTRARSIPALANPHPYHTQDTAVSPSPPSLSSSLCTTLASVDPSLWFPGCRCRGTCSTA